MRFVHIAGSPSTIFLFLVLARPALLLCRFEHLVVSLELTFFLLNLSLCVGDILVPQMELLDHLIPPFRVPAIVTSIATIFILMENVNKGLLKGWIPIRSLFHNIKQWLGINNRNFIAAIIENLQESMKKH
jgi:hypothetical protein